MLPAVSSKVHTYVILLKLVFEMECMCQLLPLMFPIGTVNCRLTAAAVLSQPTIWIQG